MNAIVKVLVSGNWLQKSMSKKHIKEVRGRKENSCIISPSEDLKVMNAITVISQYQYCQFTRKMNKELRLKPPAMHEKNTALHSLSKSPTLLKEIHTVLKHEPSTNTHTK